jgi:cob(I)alamin adenosyltransferase
MSIVTKTGDQGTTALMYNRRVSKCDDRLEAVGSVDELNAALGLARAAAGQQTLSERLLAIQHDLVVVMGELATTPEDVRRYTKDGQALVTTSLTAKLESTIAEIEANAITFSGWAMPGANPRAAALDLARTICRRAERRVCQLQHSAPPGNPEILVFLNRLSDLLWLLARQAEAPVA